MLKTGEEKDSKKYYITPDNGKNFIEWTDSKLLNSDTILEKNYSFTAKFDWSGLSSSGLVTTESFKDSNNTWTNNFAPKIEDLKKRRRKTSTRRNRNKILQRSWKRINK